MSNKQTKLIISNLSCLYFRYPVAVLPNSEEGLREFLEKKWSDKEKTIKEFKATGHFLHGNIIKCNKRWELYFALIFWTILPYFTLYMFIMIDWFRYTVMMHSIFLIMLNMSTDGFQYFEIGLHFWKQGIPIEKIKNSDF